ncbi:MAG: cytochrome c peroxidase [Burkholderiaceae bacterium]
MPHLPNPSSLAKRVIRSLAVASVACFGLASCGGGGTSTPPTLASVGDQIFHDRSLSASGRLACASCHSPQHGNADPAGTLLPLGGPNLDQQGLRSSPSLSYLSSNTAFSLNLGFAQGGFTRDGRFDSRKAQATTPLLNSAELANNSVADVVAKLKAAAYFPSFRVALRLDSSAGDQIIFDGIAAALEAYQAEDSDFARFNSKFDQFLDGQVALSAQEARGLALFNDNNTGNCVACHASAPGPDGSRPLFTGFSYFALGLPRNTAIVANADPNFFDLGLCGPKRTDLAAQTSLCGQFRVPTLRNIALTAPYFHNGVIQTLEEAVNFYATRDSEPAHWYPLVGGVPDMFNDLPLTLRGNVVQFAPFGLVGGSPRLSAQDVADLVAFLRTLTDRLDLPARSSKVGQ